MPLFTPSRIVFVVLSLTLMSFLWTWGLPHQFASPSLPVIPHDKPKEVPLGEPLIPGPVITPEPSSPSRAGQGDDNPAPPDPAATGQAGTPTTLRTEAISGTAATESSSGTPITGPFCKHVHGAPNVMVIVRTSKAEIQDKLPTHLKTLLSCVPNFAIFSDHSDTIDGVTVHDALANISNTTKQVHDEFREYDRIQAEADYKPNVDKTKALDKWKFLPMVYKAYKMQPNHKFYVFLEADTSLSWTNMLQWIDRLDFRIPIYGGAPMFQGDIKYAQRGPGILVSYGALRQYAKTYDERYASEWESHVGKECCGDIMLANAMIDSHVEFYSAFPLIQGETPSTLDWTRGHWCSPIVTWHHMSAQDLDRLWTVHQNWTHKYGWEVPYLTRNAFHEFALPHFADKIEDWDNISSDTHIKAEQGRREKLAKEKEAEEEKKKEIPKPKEPTPEDTHTEPPNPAKPNFKPPEGPTRNVRRENIEWDKIAETIKDAADNAENCQAVCQKTDDCLQWKYTPKGDGECHLGKVMRLGRKIEKKEGQDQWTSGWIMDRIKRVTEQWGECEKPNWRFNQ